MTARTGSRVLLVVMATAIAVAVLLVAVVYPKSQQVRIARLRAQRLQLELARTTALVQAKPEVERRLLAARAGIQSVIMRVPVGPQLPGLIAHLDEAIVLSDVLLVQIAFTSAEQVADGAGPPPAAIGSLGVAIQVRGTFPQVRRFTAAIEGAPRAMTIDRLAFAASQGGVLADFAVRAFYVR